MHGQSGVHAKVAGVILGLIYSKQKNPRAYSQDSVLDQHGSTATLRFFSVGILLPTFEGKILTVLLGIMIALPLGKLVGIPVLAEVRNALAPKDCKLDLDTLDFMAMSLLDGIGFTGVLLMTKRAFAGNAELIAEGNLGVVLGSLIAMVLGASLAQFCGRYYMPKHKLEKRAQQSHG